MSSGTILRIAGSVATIVALAWFLDGATLVGHLRRLQVPWVLLAVATSIVQVVASAWRWRFTVPAAHRPAIDRSVLLKTTVAPGPEG